jgi:transcriptional regulator with XRE-family HTH domain
MTQHDVASAIGAREEHIEDLEAGRTIPTTRELLLLGYVLDVPVSELLGDADR